jgi:hypothetical protein
MQPLMFAMARRAVDRITRIAPSIVPTSNGVSALGTDQRIYRRAMRSLRKLAAGDFLVTSGTLVRLRGAWLFAAR